MDRHVLDHPGTVDALLETAFPTARRPAVRRQRAPKRKVEFAPPPAADCVVDLLSQRKALMAVALRVGQDHEATRALLDQVFDVDQALGAAALSSREGAVAALRFIQGQYLGDRHNEALGIADAAVLHLIAELGEFVRSCPAPVADLDDVEIPF